MSKTAAAFAARTSDIGRNFGDGGEPATAVEVHSRRWNEQRFTSPFASISPAASTWSAARLMGSSKRCPRLHLSDVVATPSPFLTRSIRIRTAANAAGCFAHRIAALRGRQTRRSQGAVHDQGVHTMFRRRRGYGGALHCRSCARRLGGRVLRQLDAERPAMTVRARAFISMILTQVAMPALACRRRALNWRNGYSWLCLLRV